jgi:hypothetical protein
MTYREIKNQIIDNLFIHDIDSFGINLLDFCDGWSIYGGQAA